MSIALPPTDRIAEMSQRQLRKLTRDYIECADNFSAFRAHYLMVESTRRNQRLNQNLRCSCFTLMAFDIMLLAFTIMLSLFGGVVP